MEEATPRIPAGKPLRRTAHYSAFLHNVLFAVALAFVNEGERLGPGGLPVNHFALAKIRLLLVDRAKKLSEAEYTRPTIATVQAWSLLASLYAGDGAQTPGFIHFGTSVRVAQSCELRLYYLLQYCIS